MDPISFGIINGLLELTSAGQTAKKKAELDAKKKKEDALKSGMDLLGNTLTSDPETAFNFVSNPSMLPIFQTMDVNRKAAVLASASKSFETANQKRWIDTAKNDVGAARALLGDIRLLEQSDFQQIMPTIVAYASPTFTKQEFEILKDVGGDYAKAQTYLASGMYPKGSVLNAALSSIQKPDATYTAIPNETFTQVTELFKQGKNSEALSLIGGLHNTVKPYATTSQEAMRDSLRLIALKNSFGTQDGDPSKIGDFLGDILTGINQLDDQAARKSAAVASQPIVEAMAKGVKLDKWTPDAQAKWAQLVAIAGIADDAAKNRTVYLDGTNKEVLGMQTEKSLLEAPSQWLDTLNRYSTQQIATAYQNMSGDERQKFRKDVETAIVRDHVTNSQTKTTFDGKTIPANPVNYKNRYSSVYDALPFVSEIIHDKLGMPRPGGTVDGRPMLPQQVANDGETPLEPTQIRISPNRVINASQDAIAFAEANGTTPQQLLNTDVGYYGLVDLGNIGNEFRLFTPANIIKQNAIFTNKTDMNVSEEAMKSVAFTLARTGVYSRGDQLDVIAANMSGEIPRRYKPDPLSTTVNAATFEGFIRETTGRAIKMEDISKARDNASNFYNLLARAESRMARMGDQSRLADEFTSLIQNVFMLEGNLIDSAFEGGKRVWKKVNPFGVSNLVKIEDMRNDVGSAGSNKEAVELQINAFLETNYAKANVEMASLAVTLAYGYAKTMDPSGRISERDFAAAMEAVLGDITAPRFLQVEVIRDLMDQTNDNLIRADRTFGFVARAKSGDRFFEPTKDEVRRLRSLRYMDPLIRNSQDIELVEKYQADASSPQGGFGSRLFAGKYSINTQSAAEIFGRNVARQNRIVEVRIKRLGGDPQRIMGGLFVESGTGRIFSSMEIQQFKNQARGAI